MQVHRAPILLKAAGAHAEALPRMGRGIIAGCTLPTSFSRAYLHIIVAAVPKQSGHSIAEHVDDVQQSTHAGSEPAARKQAVRQGITFGKAIQASNLTPSSKTGGSVVLSNYPGTAERVAAQIRAAGLPMQATRASQDIGMTTTAGCHRSTSSTKQRCAKSKMQSLRLSVLVQRNRRAAKLFNTGVVPKT